MKKKIIVIITLMLFSLSSLGMVFGAKTVSEANVKSSSTKYQPPVDMYRSGSGYSYDLDYGYGSGRWVTSYYHVGYGGSASSEAVVCSRYDYAGNGYTAKAEVGYANDCSHTSASWHQTLID